LFNLQIFGKILQLLLQMITASDLYVRIYSGDERRLCSDYHSLSLSTVRD